MFLGLSITEVRGSISPCLMNVFHPKIPTTLYLFCSALLNAYKLNTLGLGTCVFLDNATSTNKNKHLFAWRMEIVSQSGLSFLRFCFMPAGHMKFAPDQLFSQIASSYKHSDVFTIAELNPPTPICPPHVSYMPTFLTKL